MDKKDIKALAKNVKGILLDKDTRLTFIINNLNTMYFGSSKAVLRIVKDSGHTYKDFVLTLMGLIGVDLITDIDKPYYLQYTRDTKVFSRLDLENSPVKGVVDLFYKLDNGFVDLVFTDYLRVNTHGNLTRVIKLPQGAKAFVNQDVLTDKDIEIYFDNAFIDGLDTMGLQVKGNIINDPENNNINTKPFLLSFGEMFSMLVAPMVIK
jgi:hypothetical protein